jgi:hypothetical protein
VVEQNKELEKELAAEMGIGDLMRYQRDISNTRPPETYLPALPRGQGGPDLLKILQKNTHLNWFLLLVLVFVSMSQLLLRRSGFPSSLALSL